MAGSLTSKIIAWGHLQGKRRTVETEIWRIASTQKQLTCSDETPAANSRQIKWTSAPIKPEAKGVAWSQQIKYER